MSRPRVPVALVAALLACAGTAPAQIGAPDGAVPGRSSDAALPSCNYYDDGSTIDVLVVYTTEAKNNNASNDISAYIQANADIMNECLANSHAYPRIRVVHTEELVYDDPNDDILSLHRLLDPSDGYLDNVQSLRDLYHADLVLMIGMCINCGGTAACNEGDQYIFTVNGGYAIISSDWKPDEAIGMAHELAHTMGCGHNRDAENVGPGQPLNCRYYPYSYGYDFQGNSGQWYSTIMSYGPTRCGGTLTGAACILYNDACSPSTPCAHAVPCGPTDPCPPTRPRKIFYYSNPNVLFDGQPTGVPIGNADEADNVATINNNAFTVANWRQGPGNIWVAFPYSGVELGCFEQPYNTFLEGVTAVPNGGIVISKSGSTGAAGTFQGSKTYRVKAFGGPVRIGG